MADWANTRADALWSPPGAIDGAQATGVLDIPPPELSDGPHLSYAWQWRAFTVLALAGWFILIRVEVIRRRESADLVDQPATAEDS